MTQIKSIYISRNKELACLCTCSTNLLQFLALQVMLLVIALAYIAERIAPPKVERKDSAESAGHGFGDPLGQMSLD